MAEGNRLFISCDCGGDGLLLEHDLLVHGHPDTFCLYLSVWSSPPSCGDRMTWPERAQLCWMALVHGRVYADQVILNLAGARRLRDSVSERLASAGET